MAFKNGGFNHGRDPPPRRLSRDLRRRHRQPALPSPLADVNRDLVADEADVAFFLDALQTGHPWADVDHDGDVDQADYDIFIDRWEYWSQP